MKTLFAAILASMLAVTGVALADANLFEAGGALWPHWWFRATLADAYCGFLTFFAWVAWKEVRAWRRWLWFVLIMTLGNIAMSVYVLIELFRQQSGDSVSTLLTRRNT